MEVLEQVLLDLVHQVNHREVKIIFLVVAQDLVNLVDLELVLEVLVAAEMDEYLITLVQVHFKLLKMVRLTQVAELEQ
jgi:hypothetical protein